MQGVRLVCLGAGQDVGRSCVVVTLEGATVMFDCGMHMGYADARRFPDFSLLCAPDVSAAVDVVVVTHFHLDHCGALPYLTEQAGYRGPVLMTHPTRALAAILLEDYRRICAERRGTTGFFSSEMVRASLGRATPVRAGETHTVHVARRGAPPAAVHVTAYYAGHVLGAAMFHVRVGQRSVLYTGDYNTTGDRHVGPARPPCGLCPDVLVTESTYATTLREPRRRREAAFLRAVSACVSAGGKVLVPVFALGRLQELVSLVAAHWRARGLSVPVYYSAGMAETAAAYYRAYADWGGDAQRRGAPPGDLSFAQPFQRHMADAPGPALLFSSPGMLHAGTSLEVFRRWAGDARNLLVIPGFCVPGTVGARLLAGERTLALSEEEAGVSGGATLAVRMAVRCMSFSAHADARGIMAMARAVRPGAVVLVHGEAAKMAVLRGRMASEMGLPCYDPPNGAVLEIPCRSSLPVAVPGDLARRAGATAAPLALADVAADVGMPLDAYPPPADDSAVGAYGVGGSPPGVDRVEFRGMGESSAAIAAESIGVSSTSNTPPVQSTKSAGLECGHSCADSMLSHGQANGHTKTGDHSNEDRLSHGQANGHVKTGDHSCAEDRLSHDMANAYAKTGGHSCAEDRVSHVMANSYGKSDGHSCAADASDGVNATHGCCRGENDCGRDACCPSVLSLGSCTLAWRVSAADGIHLQLADASLDAASGSMQLVVEADASAAAGAHIAASLGGTRAVCAREDGRVRVSFASEDAPHVLRAIGEASLLRD